MKEKATEMVLDFLKKYPKTIVWRIKKHLKVLNQYLNDGEEVYYAFPAQYNDSPFDIWSTCIIALTNQRMIIVSNPILPITRENSITPDLFNDFQIYSGVIFGKVTIDTAKETVVLTDIDKRALPEIETALSEYLLKEKPRFLKRAD